MPGVPKPNKTAEEKMFGRKCEAASWFPGNITTEEKVDSEMGNNLEKLLILHLTKLMHGSKTISESEMKNNVALTATYFSSHVLHDKTHFCNW